ncbi:hypothetical protein NE237_028361 [Protea cynaroides]|uniref:Uncharacterized protein n=1 Tax=Protea cynaroides TaxID=273540 RepID=A0A9Q0JSS8_9MAGN|nr:hypothetical protein NE237_028361 [Protea cynaroides]
MAQVIGRSDGDGTVGWLGLLRVDQWMHGDRVLDMCMGSGGIGGRLGIYRWVVVEAREVIDEFWSKVIAGLACNRCVAGAGGLVDGRGRLKEGGSRIGGVSMEVQVKWDDDQDAAQSNEELVLRLNNAGSALLSFLSKQGSLDWLV